MANPNLAALTNMFGVNELYQPTTTESSATANTAASGDIYRIDSIHVTNIAGTDETITVKIRDGVSGTPTVINLASTITVVSNSALQILSAPVWLTEDQDLRLQASTNSTLEVLVTYTRMNDA